MILRNVLIAWALTGMASAASGQATPIPPSGAGAPPPAEGGLDVTVSDESE